MGQTVPVVTGEYELTGKSRGASTAKENAPGGAVGRIVIGGHRWRRKGAADVERAGVGAGAGAGSEIITKGDQVKVPSETLLDFTASSRKCRYRRAGANSSCTISCKQIWNSRTHEITIHPRIMHAGDKEKVELSAAVSPLIGATTKLDSLIGYSGFFGPTMRQLRVAHNPRWRPFASLDGDNWGYNFSGGRKQL